MEPNNCYILEIICENIL